MGRKKILIVDDHSELRKLIRLTLELNDWELFEAESGEDALNLVHAILPDLVLLDIMMPGALDGLQVCSAIRSDPKFNRIKVFLLSARGQKKDIEDGFKSGAAAYLIKPFSPLELLELVEKEMAI